jgi:hypothetical protein
LQRSERDALLDGFEHLIVDEHRLGVFLAAVQHAVTHRLDATHVLDHTDFFIREHFKTSLIASSCVFIGLSFSNDSPFAGL